jgi:hypothetical protein
MHLYKDFFGLKKIFLFFLKKVIQTVQVIQRLLSKGCSCTTSVPLSQFSSSIAPHEKVFDIEKH